MPMTFADPEMAPEVEMICDAKKAAEAATDPLDGYTSLATFDTEDARAAEPLVMSVVRMVAAPEIAPDPDASTGV
jgi:hypothetical protein